MRSRDGGLSHLALSGLHAEIERAQGRVIDLSTRVEGAQPVTVAEALEELSTSLEELRVVEDELRAQNQELARARQMVEAERSRYAELFDAAPIGYVVSDGDGIIIDANRAAAALLGVDQRFVRGKPLTAYVSDAETAEFIRVLDEVAQGGRRDDWRVPLKPRHGEAFCAAVSVAATSSGVPGSVSTGPAPLLWIIRDVSAAVRDEQRIRQLNAELELRVRERTAELSEVNGHLTEALGRAEELSQQLQYALESRIVIEQAKGRLMERDGLDPDEAFAALRRHARSANRKLHEVAREVADGLLDLERMDSKAARGRR